MIPIQTEALFAIPLGITTISPDICDVLKHYKVLHRKKVEPMSLTC